MLSQGIANALFGFRDHNGRMACCRIEVIPLSDERVVVIATETADNPGMSITNAAECVASALCKLLKIVPSHLVLIEHYNHDSYHDKNHAETFDLVTFGQIGYDVIPTFGSPVWHRMKASDWYQLGIPPRG